MYHVNFNSGIELGKSFNKAWLSDKTNLTSQSLTLFQIHHTADITAVFPKLSYAAFTHFPPYFANASHIRSLKTLGYILYFIITNT